MFNFFSNTPAKKIQIRNVTAIPYFRYRLERLKIRLLGISWSLSSDKLLARAKDLVPSA